MKRLLQLLLVLAPAASFAFPEMIRHGYVNCTACHISPSGGGLLTAYGRSLSAELLSTWSTKSEESFLHGKLNNKGPSTDAVNEWLALGGDFRGVQVHTDTTSKSTGTRTINGRWINMQLGLEIGIIQPLWSLVAYLGQFNVSDRSQINQFIFQPSRYYGLYKPTDELSFKVGRFQPNFGINLPDHNLSTRTQIGIGALSYRGGINIEDKNTAEASYLGENYNFGASVYQIRPEISSEKVLGATLTASLIHKGRFKFGPQYLHEDSQNQKRNIFGAIGLLGWNEHLATLVEVDQIHTTNKRNDETQVGYVLLHRSSYELFKGFYVLFLNDYSQSNQSLGTTKVYRQGPGLTWYPRPHFDFQFFYTQELRESLAKPGVYSWLMTHYYF